MKDTQQDICKITGKAPVTERKMEKKFQWCQLCFEITNEINKTQLFLKTSINQIFSAQTNKYSVNIFLFFPFNLFLSDYPSDNFKKRKRKNLL